MSAIGHEIGQEQLGEYRVCRMLGEGGMGKVYEAEERLSGRRVALKILRPELARSAEGRRLFQSEMQILAQLEHPGVVRSLASFEHEGQLCMALELLEGRTLRAELHEKTRLPVIEAVEITCRIAEALEAAHGQSAPVVHRDLKPENVMLTAGGGLKVMDFGIAKVLAAAQATHTQSLGTLQYMSPEQIDARPVDARTDLYALGLVLYEMLSGRPPFVSSSPREMLNLQCTADPPPLPDEVRRALPRTVLTVMHALLAKRPDDRPASARAVLEMLGPLRPEDSGRATEIAPAASSPRTVTTPPSEAAAPKPVADASPRPMPPRADTLAVLERSAAPREIPTRKALVFIAVASVCAGLTTYLARAHSDAPSPSRGASAFSAASPASPNVTPTR